MVVATTSGRGQDNIAYEIVERARKVARGEIDDPSLLPVLFESEVSGVREAPRIEISGDRYVARSGDTMWDIARALEPSGDVRGVIDLLVEANGFDAPQAGQVVRIPSELSARS